MKGYRFTRLGVRTYGNEVVEKLDPRGRSYFWIGGDASHGDIPGSDCNTVLDDGLVAVTPLHLDLTHDGLLPGSATSPCPATARSRPRDPMARRRGHRPGDAVRLRRPAAHAGGGVRAAPPALPARPGDAHVEPELVGTTHVVQKGETLYRIARTYGIDPRELMEANGITDPKSLVVGQELFVPGAPAAARRGPACRRVGRRRRRTRNRRSSRARAAPARCSGR